CSPQAAPPWRVSSASASVARWTAASVTANPAAFARWRMMVRSTSASRSARASRGTSCGATFAWLSSEPRRMRSSSAWTRVTAMGAPFTTAAARGGGGAFGLERLHPATERTSPSATSANGMALCIRRLPSLLPADVRRGRRRRLLPRRRGRRSRRDCLGYRMAAGDARRTRRRRLGSGVQLDLGQLLVVDGDLGALAQALHPFVVVAAAPFPRHPLPDRFLALLGGAVHRHRLHLQLHQLHAGGRIDGPGLVAGVLQLERGVGELGVVGLAELVPGEEAEISSHRRRERILALLHRGALEGVHFTLLLAGVDVLEQRGGLLARYGPLFRVLRRQEDMEDARPLRLDEVVEVRLVEFLQLLVGNVGAGELRIELVLDQLLDHRSLHLVAHGRALVVALPDRLLGEQLVADQVLEELLLPLDRAVARAKEGTGFVQPLPDFFGSDLFVSDLG